ncbi:aspartate kinase [Xanthobacter sp.]|uniref:amino acid kinase family protein n=1 Tax=Xanthobacter sp. TaxID=35809 RepID=UPI0025F39367|nr:aspartate kinase [Xanthobacter sp.]
MTLVVKIGGSLTRGTPPRLLLERLSGRKGLVLVPGGGALADQVRVMQPQMGLSDGSAHRMAILAMEQMAYAFLDMAPSLRPARTPAELTSAAADGAALWLSPTMALDAPDIPQSWNVTSDSLALWLAARLAADRLVLIKAPGVQVPRQSDRAADLAAWTAAGLVDAAFATMARGYSGDIVLVPADDGALMEQALEPPAPQSIEETREGPRRS